MSDYSKLVKALRIRSGNLCPGDICDRCEAIHFLCSDKVMHDAAAAIEALNRLVDLNTERCEGLREQLRKAQESYERHLNELEAQLPKRGEWVRVEYGESYHYECSKCGERPLYSRYGDVVLSGVCPMCGAKMEVRDDKA